MQKIIFVEGMHCQHCVKSVTEALNALAEVSSIEVDLAAGKVTVQVKNGASEQALHNAINELGFQVTTLQ